MLLIIRDINEKKRFRIIYVGPVNKVNIDGKKWELIHVFCM